MGVFRMDNQAFLGTVGNVYKTIQIQDSFNFIDTLLEFEKAPYETIGVLGKGERFFVTARLPHDFSIGEDKIETRLLVASSHDGSMAYTAKIVNTRVVCNNTLNIALSENGKSIKIKHTNAYEEKFKQAQKMQSGIKQSVASIEGKLTELAQRKVDKVSMEKIFERLFRTEQKEDVPTRTKNTIRDILLTYENNDNNQFPEQKGTAYNLLNACTNWSDHQRPVRETKNRVDLSPEQMRSESALFGVGETFKESALEIILQETIACQRKDKPIFSFAQTLGKEKSLVDSILAGV